MLRDWTEFPFVEALVHHFGVPVWARSGVQVMTVGELRAGAGQRVRDMLLVEHGRSISAGLISNGMLHAGAQGAAGLLGSSLVADDSLDVLAGADALTRSAVEAVRQGRSGLLAATLGRDGELGPADIGHAALMGDSVCIEILAGAGRHVGEALAPIVSLINPALIVLAGSVAQTGDIVLAAVREAVYRQAHPLVTRDLRIVRSQMGSSAGLVGAAHLAVESLFDPAALMGWVTHGVPMRHPQFQAFLAQVSAVARAAPVRPQPPRAKAAISE
jgi:predicted NBD/HSP70 family sugar kinase